MRNKLSPYYDLLNETIDEEDRGDVSIFPAPATPSSLIEQVRQIITDFSNGELEFREVSGNSESEGGILLDFSDKDGKHRITFSIGAETNEDNLYPDIFQIWELDDEELSTEIEMRGTIFGLPPIFSLKQKQHLQQLKTILQKYLKRPAGLRESVDEEDFGDVDTFATPDRYQNSAVQDWIDRLVGAGLDKPGTINLCYFYMYNPEEIPEGFPDPESLKLFEDDILQILRTLPLSRFEESVQDEDDTEADVSSFPKPARKTYTIRYIGAYTSGGLSHPWLKETRFVASSLTDLFIKAACISSNSDPSRIDEDELEDVRKDYARYLEKYQLGDSEDSLRDWISHYSENLIVSLTDQQGKIIFADDVSEEEASEILLESVRKLREEDDEDFGDVTLFDAPAGLEGQRIVVAVPDADDPEADAMYGKGYNGLTGEITEEVSAPTLPGIDRTDEQWFMVYLDDEYEESKYLMLPRRWFRVLDQDEQMGDVSNFEAPSLPTYRGEVRVADIVNAYRAKQTDEDIKSFTVQYLLDHISMEDFVEYRRNRDELQQLFKDVARGLKLRESIEEEDDIGDVSSFQTPMGLEGQRVQIDIEPQHRNDFNIKDLQGMHGTIVRAESALEGQDEARLVVQLDNSERWSFPRAWVKLTEAVDEDRPGDVSSFPKPNIGHVGERVRIAVPKDERDVYDDWHGLKGTIIGDLSDPNDFYRQQVWKNKTEGLVFEPDKDMDGGNMLVPREWLKPLLSKTREAIDEEEEPGDVSGLPEPGSRYEQAVRELTELGYKAQVMSMPSNKGQPAFHYVLVNEVLSPADLRTKLAQAGYPVFGFDQSSGFVDGVGWRFSCAFSLKDPDTPDHYLESSESLIGKVVSWTTLRGETHKGPIVELDGNVAFVDCELCGKQIAVEDGAYDFTDEDEDLGDVYEFNPLMINTHVRVQAPSKEDAQNNQHIEGKEGWVTDLENRGYSGVPIVSLANKPSGQGPRMQIASVPANWLVRLDDLKEGSKMATYKDVLRETRLYENAEDIAQDLSQMQGQPVESPIPPPPDAAPKATAPTASPATDQEQQVQALFTKYYPTMGTPGAVQQISTDLKLPYAAAHAMVSHYLSQFTESGYDKDWSIPLPGETVNLVSTEMAPLDKPGVNILAGNTPDIHADSEFDLPEYTKLGAYRKRKPYGESIEEVEDEGDVAGFTGPPFPVEDMRAIYDTLVEINDFRNKISCLEGDDEDRAWRYERLVASIAHEEEFLKKEYNLTRKEAQELVQKYRGVIRENVEDEVEGHGDVSRFAPPHYESGDRVKINIPQELFSALDADTQRLNGRSGVIEDHESADESHTGEERALVLIGETNGRFEWLPMAWVQFLDPLEEATQEEEDFGDVSDYEKPGWRTYYVDYILYGHNGNEYHHAKFAAPDDVEALAAVVTGFTGSEEWKDDFEGYDEDTLEDLLNEFSNSDMDIIEIYPVDRDVRIYVGAGDQGSFDDSEDTMEDEDWDDEDE